MSNVTRIDWTVADGNVWTGDVNGYDMGASLDKLAAQIAADLRMTYPKATVTVRRENVCGDVRELEAESDAVDGYVDDETREQIRAVADAVWEADDWYVEAA